MELNRIIELLARQMGDTASEGDMDELMALLKDSPEHHYLIEILQAIETKKSLRQPLQNEEALVRDGWSKLQQKLTQAGTPLLINDETITPVKRLPSKSWMYKAALFTGVILFGGGAWFILSKPSDTKDIPASMAKEQQVVVPFGLPHKKLLPDGSVVWLNSGSRIRYAEDLLQNTREVFLEGEAYFKVKKDADHPFIVHAGNIAVRALGTEFNVQAYNNENIVATLLSGKVQVTMAEKPDQKIILTPNEKLTVAKKEVAVAGEKTEILKEVSFQVEQITPVPSIDAVQEVAWLQDKLAFKNEPFFKLAKRMERRYDMHIIFQDTLLKNEGLTGTFENENIGKALRLLQMTTPFRYRIEKDSVYLNRY